MDLKRNDNVMSLFHEPSPFSGASDCAIDFILEHGQYKTFAAGKRLYLTSEGSNGFWGVIEGKIRMSKSSENGDILTLRDYYAGNWFGLISYFASMESPYDTVAMEKTKVIYLPPSTVELLYQSFPQLYRSALNVISAISIRLAHHHFDTVNYPLLIRVVQVILRVSTMIGSDELKLSQSDIASFVGATREAVSGQLKFLENQHAILLGYRKMTIVNKEKLLSLVGRERNWAVEENIE